MPKIRVVLADDHRLVREGFRALLSAEQDIEVVGQAVDGREAMRVVGQTRADVLVMDLQMPGMSGLEALRQLKKQNSPVRVLVLTMHKEIQDVLRVLRAGAAGYILKDAAATVLAEGIRTVHQGDVYLDPTISTRVVTLLLERLGDEELATPLDVLTDREREVLQLIGEGRSRQEIAETLCVSPKTVDAHRANIMRKLNAEDTAALVRIAVRYGMVSL